MSDESVVYRTVIFVNRKPYCFWDADPKARNLEFINSIDPKYYSFIAVQNSELLQGEEKHYAAMNLKNGYQHSLETFFALFFAAFQAPDCVAGWLSKYQNEELRELVKILLDGGTFKNKFKIFNASIESYSALINKSQFKSPERRLKTIKLFARMWEHFARDFLNEESVQEYNSMKHGMRARMGGFSLSIGIEDAPGVAAPFDSMHAMGGSEFGATFFVPAPMSLDRKPGNFKLRRRSNNWDPDQIARRIELVSLSISNLISFLKHMNGSPIESLLFLRPEEDEVFSAPWSIRSGVSTASFDVDVQVGEENLLSRDQMKDMHRQIYE